MKAAVARARRGERGSLRSASPGRIADEADDTDEEEEDEVEDEVEDETEDAVEDEVEDEAVVAMPDIVKD
ncbi:hypothetical protein ACFYU9_21485 [Streptomyces sp. NPDC004327]|uniref:hypothetical protein n=1 Tax=Streptomyces sp. NPDC004327 TaxID=3364699 RepID=UPI00367966B8